MAGMTLSFEIWGSSGGGSGVGRSDENGVKEVWVTRHGAPPHGRQCKQHHASALFLCLGWTSGGVACLVKADSVQHEADVHGDEGAIGH